MSFWEQLTMMFYSSTQLHLDVENVVLLRQDQNLKKSHVKKQKVTSWKCFAVHKMHQQLRKDENLLSFSFGFSSDIPLYESPGKASFDQYLEDKSRLIKATFPGKSQQLNQEEWRIETPKIQLLFLKIWPVIDMKMMCKTSGKGYPTDVPHHIPKVLELEMTNWEINGIHRDYRPSSASVCSKGAIYSEKKGSRSRLKFQLLMNLSFVVPHALSFVPKDVLRSIFETVFKAMVEDLKQQTIDKLVEDYCEFRKEKEKKYL